MTSSEKVAGHEGPLAEFAALRQEIDESKRSQLQILALQLTVSGAVFGFVLSVANVTELLLVLPISSYLLCGRYVSQHFGCYLAAQYIRVELSSQIPGGLGWEAWLRGQSPSRLGLPLPRRLWVSTLPLLLSFTGTAALALVWVSRLVFVPPSSGVTPGRLGLVILWLVGAVATGASMWLITIMRRTHALAKEPY